MLSLCSDVFGSINAVTSELDMFTSISFWQLDKSTSYLERVEEPLVLLKLTLSNEESPKYPNIFLWNGSLFNAKDEFTSKDERVFVTPVSLLL